ncbi:hypothetical protein L0F51_00285 [Afifella sp. H1R]|uniref:phage protein n=1 Tax=Afifella sp. H1R TaxID=2908841 RepID=UPI001F36AD83|nr:hypothetical protein [Afifella sp. H1R]MCF1502202.1 hypothetical protein [Afifella sp. H1R]
MWQYLRKIRVTFNGGALVVNPGSETDRQLRVRFSVSKGISGVANTATIEIFNLAKDRRKAVGKELDDVLLEAGYWPPTGGNNVGIIFKGQMRDVEHRYEGADIITKLECGDGDRGLRRATISKTFPAGTPVKEVVEELQRKFEEHGIDRGEWRGLDDLPPYKRPYSMCSTCDREMDRIARSNKLYWSIQNGAMEIITSDGFIESAVYLTPETGLIGVPTLTDNGIRCDALLNPEVRPNRKVVVQSKTLEMNSEGGVYRVSQAAYTGDNRDDGPNFIVTIAGERIESGKVDEGVRR